MNRYIIPAILIIAFIMVALLFFPNADEKKIRNMIHECENCLIDKDIQPIIDYLDERFIVPDYNLDIDDILDENFTKKTLHYFDNLDVRKINIEIDENSARAYMIVRVTNSKLKYNLPFEVNAELVKRDENWRFTIVNVTPYKIEQ
ncbi:MAG: hypothetical protein KAR20_24000 [Candidatus Heimdallarchaeota archaeon]|nr:hypothetical protein [Candidatus Heimdallarchaeota archaeon]